MWWPKMTTFRKFCRSNVSLSHVATACALNLRARAREESHAALIVVVA